MSSSSQTAFFCHESFFWHDTGPAAVYIPAGGYVEPGEHVEAPGSKRRLRNLLETSGLLPHLVQPGFGAATDEQILRFHTAEHLKHVRDISANGGGDSGEFAPIAAGGFEIAALSAGAAVAAVDAVMSGAVRNAYALTRPPGHHAIADKGLGFCTFGNLVIAAHQARSVHDAVRIAIVDWDVHHGNGTQAGFYDDPDVLTISIHQDGLYPADEGAVDERGTGKGVGANLNIPLPSGCGHDTYLAAFDQLVRPAIKAFKPDLIMVACGYDAAFVDPLGRMLCFSETYRALTAGVMQLADDLCDGRVVMTHEGGYSAGYVPFCGLAVIEQLSGQRTPCDDPFIPLAEGYPDQRMKPEHQNLLDEIRAAVTG